MTVAMLCLREAPPRDEQPSSISGGVEFDPKCLLRYGFVREMV